MMFELFPPPAKLSEPLLMFTVPVLKNGQVKEPVWLVPDKFICPALKKFMPPP